MIIGIINFHFAHNFGAVLESLALKEYIEKKGHTVLTIDYRPEYLTAQYDYKPNPFAYARWAAKDFQDRSSFYRSYRMFRRFIQALTYYKDFGIRKKRFYAFDNYVRKHMTLTCNYNTIGELRNNPPACDIYISGSDQIWNPKVTAGIDEAYYLCFGSSKVKRIAYAVSPCQLEVDKYKERLKKLLCKYNQISLRESEYIKELRELTNTEIKTCTDPTLLLKKEDYLKYIEPPRECVKEYILVYGFADNEKPHLLNEIAKTLALEKKFDIIDVSMDGHKQLYFANKQRVVSPGEFLYYVNNASYIVTNSFHGTVFSIIFKKQFIAVTKSGTVSRLSELVDNLGLNDRLLGDVNTDKIIELSDTKVDYLCVEKLLNDIRYSSEAFLSEAIG